MRLDRLLPLAAAALLAACNPQSAEQGGAARAPLPAVQAPKAKIAAPACDCPTDNKAKAAAGGKVAAQQATHRVVARKAIAHPERRTYRRYEALAGGPPVVRSEYARVPHEYYENNAATSYRYGPAYAPPPPPPPAYSDRDEDWGPEYRYEHGDAARHRRHGGRYGERRADRDPPSPRPLPPRVEYDDRVGPPPHQTKRAERGSSYESGSSYSERYSYRDGEARRLPPPAPQAYGYQERRASEGRYEERSESSSSYERRSERLEGPCCRTEAAGFDANGFLTWPGKVPARP